MAVYTVQDMTTIAHLFVGRDETFVRSCLQGCMGIAYADSLQQPTSAQISVGDFCFFAGTANDELARNRPQNLQSNFAILAPQNHQWEQTIERCLGSRAVRHVRYAVKKEPHVFDEIRLEYFAGQLADGYELRLIDHELYKQIQGLEWARDLCSNFNTYQEYRAHGLGVVAVKDDIIVSGASSYIWFEGGIEIEIDTRKDQRRKGLALACGATLILECLAQGLYPSWDAHNKASLALAEKLGYHFEKEYLVYEVEYTD